MKLEQQVVSLELAKRLKELGVEQESYFGWIDGATELLDGYFLSCDSDKYEYSFPAFTVAEMGGMLPKLGGYGWHDSYKRSDDAWVCLRKVSSLITEYIITADTEADAKAKMLIYLLENKLI